MRARADAMHATTERILDAAAEIFWAHPSDRVSLDAVGRHAQVTKQTVLRHFGTKDALLSAVASREFARIRAEREDIVPGDVQDAVRALVRHYERVGDPVMRLLAEAERSSRLATIAEQGRVYHAAWCLEAFAAALAPLRGAAHERRHAQLVAVTDVRTWWLLRRDRGLGPRQAETAIRELVESVIASRP